MLRDEGLLALMGCIDAGGCRSLTHLILQRNDLTDAAASQMMATAAKYLHRLEHLCLKQNQLSVSGAIQIAGALARTEDFPRLRMLSLQNNPLAHDAAAQDALAHARALRPAMQPGLYW